MTDLTRRTAMAGTAAAVASAAHAQPAPQPVAPYTAACVQTRVIPTVSASGADADALEANIRATIDGIERGAGEHGAKLLVFSEFNLQFAPTSVPVEAWLQTAITVPGPEIERIAKAAQATKTYVAINPVEKIDAFPGRYFLSGVVIGPNGDVLVNYRKLYDLSNKTRPSDMLDAWLAKFGPESLFPVADTPIGRIGCAVALDVQWPEMIRSLVFHGAEIIANSTASPLVARGYTLPDAGSSPEPDIRTMVRRVRAFENLAYILTTNLGPTGRDEGQPLLKMLPSEIIDYRGRSLATAKDSAAGFITAPIDIEALRTARTTPEAMNGLAQLQVEAHRADYGMAQFARVNHFAGRVIQTSDEHRPFYRADIKSLVDRGIFKAPAAGLPK